MKKKAVLLTTRPGVAEMEELVFALGAELVATIYQRRPAPDPQLYLGRGRMEEARESIRGLGTDVVVVNGQLKPGQIYSMQSFLDVGRPEDAPRIEVYDRTRLILEIFRERARSPEARLQVELAQLHYEMPLVKEAISQQRKGERQAAMFGGGQYEVNQYYDMMKKRMSRIRRELEKMRLERGVRRKHRRRSGFHLVSLAGYTNAGKSSLLQALSKEHAVIENRYFSTLSTKTARAQSERREILVTDTVGFIEDLPPWMIDAFHSTLEEIALADVILLVVDASDPVEEMARRLRSSLRVLWEFDTGAHAGGAAGGLDEPGGSHPGALASASSFITSEAGDKPASRVLQPVRRGLAPILVALNKSDRLAPGEAEAKRRKLEEEGLLPPGMSVALSAKTGEGLDELFEHLYALIPDYDEYEIALPPTDAAEAFLGWLHAHADVLDLTRGNEAHVHFEAKRSLRPDLARRLAEVSATPLREVVRATEEPDDAEGGAPRAPAGAMLPNEDVADPPSD